MMMMMMMMVMMMMMMMIMIMKMTKIQDNLPRRRKTLPASKSQFNTNHDYFCDENKGLLMMEQKMFEEIFSLRHKTLVHPKIFLTLS